MTCTTPYHYKRPKADITTDAVVFGLDLVGRKLKVLLIKRGRPGKVFYDHWAIPGGFLNIVPEGADGAEDLETGCRRELEEETGLTLSYLEQLYTFGKPGRDPRGRVITVAYWGIVRPDQVTVRGMDDAKEARWFDVNELPDLAFDHADVLEVAVKRLRGKLRWAPVGVWLLPAEFTLTELRSVYEIILGREVDPSNFRKKIRPYLAKDNVLPPTGTRRKAAAGRPAALYTFNASAYQQLLRDGLDFEV